IEGCALIGPGAFGIYLDGVSHTASFVRAPGPVKHDEGTSSSGRLVPVARPGTSSGHPVRTLPRTAGPRTLLGSLYCETATCSFLRRRTRSPPGRATPPVSDF